MQSIKFNEGYKEFAINNDEKRILRFNPSDIGLMNRIDEVTNELENIEKELKSKKEENVDEIAAIAAEADKRIKGQFNYLLNSDDAADVIFDGQSSLNLVKGSYLFVNVIEALVPIIKKEVEAEIKASEKRVSKYTENYKK